MNTFISNLEQVTNIAYTENGAVSNLSSLDPVLDFFSLAGSMRGDPTMAVNLFNKAYASNPLSALRVLFYLRDIRGGQGERNLFRSCIKQLPTDVQKKLVKYIPEYGRYDDLLALNPGVSVSLIKEQLEQDLENMKLGKGISLLAKWLPSENTSSTATQDSAKALMRELDMKPAQYRKTLSTLRAYLKVLEVDMSSNRWGDVNYEKLPSQAHRKHVKAFKRRDTDRYQKYLEAVEAGEKKIKTSTLYTYEVYEMLRDNNSIDVANLMWASLPDYTNGSNALVVADVSGSMSGRPLSVSVSLALYFAERNAGVFNGYFMTFSREPRLQKVVGNTLSEKTTSIERADWEMNTDLEKALLAILEAGKNAPKEEMPKVLYIISDMEFDTCVRSEATNYNNAKRIFNEAGFELPHVVFWNVDARNKQAPATKYDGGVSLFSGLSQSTFKHAVLGKTPLETMNEVINSERYKVIEI